jgi:hypothetical protein
METKLRLIYHFYAFDGMQNSPTCELHFACLSEYSKVFTESIFVISVDDVSNNELINYVKRRLIECGFVNNVSFIIKQNSAWQETETFYEMVVKKLGKLDGLTFFAHSKGVGNELDGRFNMEEIHQWIVALYFLNLNYVNEVIHCLIRSPFMMSYGALKCSWDDIENKNKWIYSGTFFWINAQRIHAMLERNGTEVPTPNNRYYSECFLGDVLTISPQSTSHDSWYLFGDECQGWYHMASKYIPNYFHRDDEIKEYNTFKNKVLCKIK